MDDDEDNQPDAPDGLPTNLRYVATVALTPDEVRASFSEDPLIGWYADGNPPPLGVLGDEEFEAWPHGPTAIVVRKRVALMEQTPSPYVRIDVEPLEPQAARVSARFVRRPPGASLSKWVRAVTGLIAVGGIISAIAYVVFMPLVILHPTVWGTVVVGVAALVALARYSQNRPKPESMASFGAPLWGLIGSKLVPHAIGTGEDPFRLQALQAPRK